MNQRLSNAPTTQRSRGATRAGRCLHDERGTRARAPSSEGCMTDTGTDDSGLGIFTRHQTRNDTIMERVREIASAKGLDLAVRDAVQQPLDCDVTEIVELPRLRHRWRAVSIRVSVRQAHWRELSAWMGQSPVLRVGMLGAAPTRDWRCQPPVFPC